MPSGNLSLSFAGHTLVLDASGAVYWPAQGLLAVSDMHLEKGSFLATHGHFIPPYDTRDTLDRLDQLIAHYAPQELLLLGDSFHDRQAWNRLEPATQQRIQALSHKVKRCSWLEGNHDTYLQDHGLELLAGRELAGLLFTHEATPNPLPQIIGHYHPKIRLRIRGQKLRLPCFVCSSHRLILPSFGSYTGGLDITDPVFDQVLLGAQAQAYVIHAGHIHAITPLSAPGL